MKQYDAVIIGAGHNGLTNAAYLAKAGLDVCVVDKQTFPRPKLCAGLITWKTVQCLKKIFDSVRNNLAEDGKFIFVTSSLSNNEKLIKYAQKLGLKTRIIARKKLFFEELILVESNF